MNADEHTAKPFVEEDEVEVKKEAKAESLATSLEACSFGILGGGHVLILQFLLMGGRS